VLAAALAAFVILFGILVSRQDETEIAARGAQMTAGTGITTQTPWESLHSASNPMIE
jgi:hypothetical protein